MCLRGDSRALMDSPASSRRPWLPDPKRLKSIWALASLFTTAFAWRAADSMSPMYAVSMWTMAELIAVGGSYVLFLRRNDYRHHKERLKAVLWILVSLLELGFAWRMMIILPPAFAIALFLKAGSVAIGGFYALFNHRTRRPWLPEPKRLLAIWALASLFTTAFAWRAADSMPPMYAVAMWTMAELIAVGGSYVLFLRRNDYRHHKERLKAVLWILASLLELAFAWRMLIILPPTFAVGVILKAGFIAIGGFYALFIHRNGGELLP